MQSGSPRSSRRRGATTVTTSRTTSASTRASAPAATSSKPPRCADKRAIHFEYLDEFREFLQWRSGDAALLGEANVRPQEARPYFADGNGLHMMFNFWVNQHLFLALAARDDPRRLRLAYSIVFSLPGTPVLRYGDEIGMG